MNRISIRTALGMAVAGGMLLLAASCGLDSLGVLTIGFDLGPAAVDAFPEGIDEADFAMLDLAHGRVEVDVLDGHGTVTAQGLPELPEGFEYEVHLQMAHGDREALDVSGHHGDEGGGHHPDEGEEAEGGGHEGGEDGAFESIAVGSMQMMGGTWMSEFGHADMDHHAMGAIRAASVVIEPPAGEHVTVLSGEVDLTGGDPGEGGHEHGA
jgi:hypothetical protein